jgi:CelD/BcsL family acetyltransferase involved in cellulose biosynthesis
MLTEFVSRLIRSRPIQRWRVRELSNWGDLEPWQGAWEALHDQTPQATFFQSWTWLQTYWRHFGQDQQLKILIVQEPDGTPTGIVPLTIRKERHALRQVRRLAFPLDNWGTCYGPLGPQPAESLTAALHHVRHRPDDWDSIDLRWIPSECCPGVVAAFRDAGLQFQQRLWSRTGRIDLTRGWDDYWNNRSSKWRNNQRRSEKALSRLGRIQIVHFRPDEGETDPRWDLYGLCEQVASLSWQGACPSGNTLNHPHVRDFLRDLHAAAVETGRIYLSLLLVGEQPAAFTYNYLSDGVVHGLRMGYDLRFQSAGPGSVLLRESIREACSRGDGTMDLGESPSEFKRHWENGSFETFRFCHQPFTKSLASVLGLRRPGSDVQNPKLAE